MNHTKPLFWQLSADDSSHPQPAMNKLFFQNKAEKKPDDFPRKRRRGAIIRASPGNLP
jgi:hypothetical protein